MSDRPSDERDAAIEARVREEIAAELLALAGRVSGTANLAYLTASRIARGGAA